jgi:ApeA N-terminal domain 1
LDTFELAGQWWLPESPNERKTGLLKYSDEDGFTLKIPFGNLGNLPRSIKVGDQPKSVPILLGILINGKTVTLVDVLMTNMNLNFPGGGSEEYKCLFGFIGSIESESNPQIDKLQVKLSHLRDWIGWHPSEATLVEDNQTFVSIDYHFEPPLEAELAAGDGWTIKLSHKADMTLPSIKGFSLTHDCILALELDQPLQFDKVEELFLTPIWQFLSFCIDRSTHIQELKVLPFGQTNWLEVGRSQGKSAISEDFLMEPYMLLSMQQLSERTAEILCRWLEFEGDERRAISLLVGINNDRGSFYSDLRFLAAAQALEAMSRVDANEYELNDEEFKRRFSAVLNSLEDCKVRKWAKRKLEYANSRSTSELLQDLVSNIGEYVSTLAPDRQQFFSDIRDNRNFYTHRDDRRAKRILEGSELYLLTQGLICVLKASVLRRLGFSQEETHNLMKDCEGCLEWQFRVAKQYSQDITT